MCFTPWRTSLPGQGRTSQAAKVAGQWEARHAVQQQEALLRSIPLHIGSTSRSVLSIMVCPNL